MKKPRICRNCVYCDKNAIKMWCSYWKLTIGPLAATQGCEKFEDQEFYEELMND